MAERAGNGAEYVVETKDLKMHFEVGGGGILGLGGHQKVLAVDGVSLGIRQGETLGLVGESGCGKTTVGRTLLRLTPYTDGHVYFEGRDIFEANARDMKDIRKEMQIVFQDPFSSLNPRMLIKDVVGEPLLVHGISKGEELRDRVTAMLERVGLNPEHLYRYPHEFSGGQRQRIGVARALALNPEFIVLDEPTSALDVSVQAQILNLLNDLQNEFNLTYLFISHDLSTIRYMCDRINVMYLGKVVESAPKDALFDDPKHPYTKALLSVIPVPDPAYTKERIVLSGDVPSPANPPSGCRFHTRCKYREAICEKEEPPLREIGKDHYVACHMVK